MTEPRESVSNRKWSSPKPPEKILVIRLHAIGDVAITFPSCVALRTRFSDASIDFLTLETTASLPASLEIFNSVHGFPYCDSRWERLRHALAWANRLRHNQYQVVLDLQRNWVSRMLRRAARPQAWSEFDRFSPRLAGLRTLDVFHRIGFVDLGLDFRLPVRSEVLHSARSILQRHGWKEGKQVVVLNPAGFLPTRNWPLENYSEFARLWLNDEETTFLMMGPGRIGEKSKYLSDHLGSRLINLVGQTSLPEALGILQQVSFVLSEDSGLMHMAWVSGIPTLALFGSSRHDWSAPVGPHTRCLHSGDLPCGACMSPTCRYGDIHCLTRYTPQSVYALSREMMNHHLHRVRPL